jgi:hypothetical protein
MKNLILLLTTASILLAGPVTANASECKFVINEVDPFTGKLMVTTAWEPLKSGMSEIVGQAFGDLSDISAAAVREGEQDYLALKLKLSDTTGSRPSDDDLQYAVSVPEGAGLWVVMGDQTTVQLFTDKAVRGKTKAKKDGAILVSDGRYLVKSTVIIRYALDAAAREALTQQSATGLRLNLRNRKFEFGYERGHIDFGIHEKSVGDISAIIGCLE